MLETWRGCRTHQAQLCTGRCGYRVVVSLVEVRCGYRGGSGDRDGDPTKGVGLDPKDPDGRWNWRQCDGLLALPVPGASHVLDGQQPEESSKPQRTQNWSPVANDHPLISGTPQFQLDRVPPRGADADPREDSKRHPMQSQVTVFMR